jgi:ABC-type bacteriocin/lantibiotic exporter with double-glycine peptidase domain
MRRALIAALLLTSCAAYQGPGRPFEPARLGREGGWLTAGEVTLVRQQGDRDCGAAALAMMTAYWGRPLDGAGMSAARQLGPKGGAPAGRLRDLARDRGLAAYLVPATLKDLRYELRRHRPVLVGMLKRHGDQLLAHYEVVVAMNPVLRQVVTLDPARGWQVYDVAGFLSEWEPTDHLAMVVIGVQGAPAPPPVAAR